MQKDDETAAPGELNLVRPLGRSEVAQDAIAFVATVAWAAYAKWGALDLIWGLWICSLTLGFAWIFAAIVSAVLRAQGGARIVAAAGGLFMAGFFTVHFGMFHFVHGIFLNGFFPLTEGRGRPDDMPMIVGIALSNYWPLIATTFLSRASDFPRPSQAIDPQKAIMAPYANVVRMHLLIFVFAGLQAAQLSHLAVYPVIAFYFFPWGRFFKSRRKGAGTEGEQD